MKEAEIVDALNEKILTFEYDLDNISTENNLTKISSISIKSEVDFRQLYNLVKIGCYIKFESDVSLYQITGLDNICFPKTDNQYDPPTLTIAFSTGCKFDNLDLAPPEQKYLAMGGWYHIRSFFNDIPQNSCKSIIVDNGERVGEAEWDPYGGIDCEGAFVWVNHHNSDFKADMVPQPLYWQPLPRPFKDRYK